MPSLKQMQREYDNRYGDIPLNYHDRLAWMMDRYKVSQSDMLTILQERDRRMNLLYYERIKVVLFQVPQGAKRPRYRFINKSNLATMATMDPGFIHVYSPGAAANHDYMKRLVTEQDIMHLNHLICTPCVVHYKAFFPTPKSYNKLEIFMSEMGLDRPIVKPDFDNIAKLYADMYNSNVWLDDAFTISGTVDKYYSILPRVEIDLDYLNAVYCKQQYQNITRRKDYTEDMNLRYI